MWKDDAGSFLVATSIKNIYIYNTRVEHLDYWHPFHELSGWGKELRRMLKEHGDFQQMEVTIAKKNIKTDKQNKAGGWYTKFYLEKVAFWNKTWT